MLPFYIYKRLYMDDVYAFDLKLVCGGFGYFSTYTYGSAPGPSGLEFRTPSLLSRELFTTALNELGKGFFIIDDAESFYNWTCVQGWGVINSEFAREVVPHWLKKRECIKSPYGSFTDVLISSTSVRKRTFRGKFKNKILERDGNRCVLCSSQDELTLQHVVPYSKGGETNSRNLVTLCAKCNQNMGVEYNRELYELAGLRCDFEPSMISAHKLDLRAFERAVQFSHNIMNTRCELY